MGASRPTSAEVDAVYARLAGLLHLDPQMASDRRWLERVLRGLGDAMDPHGLRQALLRRGAAPEEVEQIFAVLAAEKGAPAAGGPGQRLAAKPSSI